MTTAPLTRPAITPGETVSAFFDAIGHRDLDGAFALVSRAVETRLEPIGDGDVRRFFEAALAAFPDLMVRTRRTIELPDGRVLTEATFEGTQAADFLGILNQEKYVDLEQAWLIQVSDGQIVAITGYWDQNKLYRRLAVKRLDQISIAS